MHARPPFRSFGLLDTQTPSGTWACRELIYRIWIALRAHGIVRPFVGRVTIAVFVEILVPEIAFPRRAREIVGTDAPEIATGTVVFDLVIFGAR